MKKRNPNQIRPILKVDSDLVSLIKEFESIKQQLNQNDAVVETLQEQRTVAENEVQRVRNLTQSQRENAQIQRRVLEAQFVNVRELLSKALGMNQYNGECAVQNAPGKPRY